MKKVLGILAGFLAALGVFAFIYADNLRALFASSSSALGGSGHLYGARVYPRKALRSFGDSTSHAPAPDDARNAKADPRPTLPPGASTAWTLAAEDARSTFGADVDTASYSYARRSLVEGRLPEAESVRAEEFINSFDYRYPGPEQGPFTVIADLAPSPFRDGVHLLRVGIQARRVAERDRKPAHLTFLVDVSGSMQAPDKLPLARASLKRLVRKLREGDTVSLVTYAGETSEVLAPVDASRHSEILAAIDDLRAGGGTSMGSGMQLAYRNAVRHVRPGQISRVIVVSDGDANIGATSPEAILESIRGYVQEGVTLSTIGFGMGDYRDDMMEKLADKGNGNAFYVDSERQAQRVFEEGLTGMLEVVAKDMKLQVEFNPRAVKAWRQVGYENRALAHEDFRNDRADGGEVGAGHAVTALWELELTGAAEERVAEVRVRAKPPEGSDRAVESDFDVPLSRRWESLAQAPASFRLAVAAAAFAERLQGRSEVPLSELQGLADAAADFSPDADELASLVRRLDEAPQRARASRYALE